MKVDRAEFHPGLELSVPFPWCYKGMEQHSHHLGLLGTNLSNLGQGDEGDFKGKALTGRFLGCAQVQGVVSSAHGDAVDGRAAVSDDAQAHRLPTVPETGSAIPGAGQDIPSPIHNGSVQNTCMKPQTVFILTQKSTQFPELNSTTGSRPLSPVTAVTHRQVVLLEKGACGRQQLPENPTVWNHKGKILSIK